MKVSEIAAEFKTTTKVVLDTLKSLKLKAKDQNQELNIAVVSVLRSHLKKAKDLPSAKDASPKSSKKEVETKEKEDKSKKVKEPLKEPTIVKKQEKKEEQKKLAAAPQVEVKKKKELPPSTPPKVLPKISDAPMIALKPLSRRRRKQTGTRGKSGEFLEGSETVQQEAVGSGQQPVGAVSQSSTPTQPLADLEVKVPISVKDLSAKMQQKPSMVLKQLMKMGILTHINQSLDEELVRRLAKEFGFNIVSIRTQEEQLIEMHEEEDVDPALLKTRAPVVTFMGHVDHGKTSLIDRIRKTKLTDAEHGGITQHIGAYSVNIPKGRITFLDTPGHEAFTAMRRRGVHITDLVVLVVAADEGIMPQTEEAIDHARAAGVPIVVALNKIDKRDANIDRVKKQLMERDLNPEDWGGKTVVIGVSATTGEGVDNLLELILLESEMLELKANPDKKASGIVVEAHLSHGKGAVSTLIVQNGTLRVGDLLVAGPYYGRVKAMFDDRSRSIQEAGPSMPVEILGLPEVPEAGEKFYVVDDEKYAKEISFKRQEHLRNLRLSSVQKFTLEDLYAQVQQGAIKELNVVMKADVQGSLEALKDALGKIPSDKVKLKFIHTGVGDVNLSDVLLAATSKAIIIAFHVGMESRVKNELEHQPVDIRQYRIIYDAVNDVRNALEGLLEAKSKKVPTGRIEVREVFKLSRGIVAGCYVQKGHVHRKVNVDVIRNADIVFTGKLTSLKRFKDDVRDVNEGMECGVVLEGFDKFEPGDIIDAYEIEKIAQKL